MEKILSSAWIFVMLSTMLSVDASARKANQRSFSFYRLIDKGFGILIFILLIACAAAFLLDRYFNKSATPEEDPAYGL